MRLRGIQRVPLFLAAIGCSLAAAAAADTSPPARADAPARVAVNGGLKKTARAFDAADLARLPQLTVAGEVHGNALSCTGPSLISVLAQVDAPTGESIRGGKLQWTVLVTAADGYRVTFSLAELDPAFRGAVPIVTASCNGQPLDAKDGPFRLAVPGDKRPARWVRQVTAVDLVRTP